MKGRRGNTSPGLGAPQLLRWGTLLDREVPDLADDFPTFAGQTPVHILLHCARGRAAGVHEEKPADEVLAQLDVGGGRLIGGRFRGCIPKLRRLP